MRLLLLAAALLSATLTSAGAAGAQEIRRVAPAGAAIANSTELPPNARIVYISGTVPAVVDQAAPQGSVQRFGDTATQTRTVLRAIAERLQVHGMTLGDVVMMRIFLVAPPGQEQMDFAGMMTGYREFFGTADQPNVPARSTMEVAGLVDPGWLVEIEVTAAEPEPGS